MTLFEVGIDAEVPLRIKAVDLDECLRSEDAGRNTRRLVRSVHELEAAGDERVVEPAVMCAEDGAMVARQVERGAYARRHRIGLEHRPFVGHRTPIRARAQARFEHELVGNGPTILGVDGGAATRAADEVAVPERDDRRHAVHVLKRSSSWKSELIPVVDLLEFRTALELVATSAPSVYKAGHARANEVTATQQV